MEEEVAREEQLKLLQDGRVYPVGRVLRTTFDADNHDTLGSDVAGLMINLSRVPYEPLTTTGRRPASAEPPRAGRAGKPGVLARLGAWLRGQ